MRESRKMFIHYTTGILIGITGLVHLIANNVPGIGTIIHDSILYPINMLIFLTALLYHMLNGIRVILIELIPGWCATRVINWIVLIVGILLYVYAIQVLVGLFWLAG